MASRCCFVSLPSHLEELPRSSPRLGPMSRGGFEADAGVAGHLFTVGEHDERVVPTIDTMTTGKRRCQLASPDAGFRSPRPDPRARTIDCHEARRSASAPPRSEATRIAQVLSMQSFGILPDVDGGLGGRRQCTSPKPSAPTRQESAKRAIQFQDIAGVQRKRQLSPQHSPSPSAIKAMQTIDIDARAGHGRSPGPARSPSRGILPMDSPSYSLTCPANYMGSPRSSPRVKSYNYFEETLSAERYAKLIGRPHVRTDKGLRRMNLALELERREKFNPASIYDLEGGKDHHDPLSTASTTASGCSTPLTRCSTMPILSIASQLENLDVVRSGVEEKLEALRAELDDQKLSALHKRAVAEGANEDELAIAIDSESQKEAYVELIVAKVDEALRKQPAAMPLALRRVVASLIPNEVNVPEALADDLRTAFRASAHTIQKFQGPRRNRSPNLSPRQALSPRLRAGRR